MIYHATQDGLNPACGEFDPHDQLVPLNEALLEGGRHFNCVACHKALTGNQRHSRPAEGE